MKKLLLFTAAILALQAIPALAEDGAKEKRGGKMMERMFTEQDADGNGSVSKDEFTAHANKRFEAMDGNKDGGLTKEEIKAHHEAKKAEWKAKRDAAQATDDKPAE